MKRRNFILGTGALAAGGAAMLGTGAFSRVESHRSVTIQVAEDPDAYLGLDGCPDSANSSYTEVSEETNGHLKVDMSPSNPTDAGGEGVNSNSITSFDDVFQIRNQGKEAVCVDLAYEPLENDNEEPAVLFYVSGARDENSSDLDENYVFDPDGIDINNQTTAYPLGVGDSICVGIQTRTFGLSDGDQLIEDNEVKIVADVDGRCDLGEVEAREEGFYIEVFDDTGASGGDAGDLDPDHGTITTNILGGGTELEIDLDLTGGAEDAYLEKAYGTDGVDLRGVNSIEIDITEFDREDQEGVAYFAAVNPDDLGVITENSVSGVPVSAVNRENLRQDGSLGHLDGDEPTGTLTDALDAENVAGSAVKLSRSDGVITAGGATTENITFSGGEYTFDDDEGTVQLDVSDLEEDSFICVGAGQLSDGSANSSLLRVTQARFDNGTAVFSFVDQELPVDRQRNPYRE